MHNALTLSSIVTHPLAESLAPQLINGDAEFSRVSTDSRSIQSGDLFIALKGDSFDGHDFLQLASQKGASGLVVEHADTEVSVPQLVVSDTTRAYGIIAKVERLRHQGPLIALTGSCGKTTVKEMVAAILTHAGQVHVTEGNLNNHIGVPKTLLAMPSSADFAVVEMGASGPGEIAYLSALAEPTVALVNNVNAAHLEGFGSEADIAREKSSIYLQLRQQGCAVVNLDEPYASGWLTSLSEERPDLSLMTFSCQRDDAAVFGSDHELQTSGCYRFVLHYSGQQQEVNLPVMGRQNIANALAAASCCLAAGVSLKQVVLGLQSVAPVAGRLLPHKLNSGGLLIDDSYNANPGSVLAAAKVLADLQSRGFKGVLALGDLAELGADEAAIMEQMGRDIQQLGVQQLYTVGLLAKLAGKGFSSAATTAQKFRHCEDQQQLMDQLNKCLGDGFAILVKGSRSARMDDVVRAIISNEEPI